jgi:hypothetical protein
MSYTLAAAAAVCGIKKSTILRAMIAWISRRLLHYQLPNLRR